ncbi:hypothetical protein BDQ17DRAFT_574288 [Cyathus striatus]|nr:hypothetical protein BDQ17DRAFT_574288 [Cyathus striatus]
MSTRNDGGTPLSSPAPSPAPFLGSEYTSPLLSHTKTIHQDETYMYSYSPPGLSDHKHNSTALANAFLASIGGFGFGYDQGVVSFSFGLSLWARG